MNRIESLYYEAKFKPIVEGLQANSVFLAEELSLHTLQRLEKCSVEQSLIEEAVKIYIQYLNATKIFRQASSRKQTDDIAKFYKDIPNGTFFAKYCSGQLNKQFMSQLSSSDFESDFLLDNVGKVSARVLESAFCWHGLPTLHMNTNAFSIEVSDYDAGIFEIPIEKVFSELSHGEVFIRYCHANEIFKLVQLHTFNFSFTKVKGIGLDSMEQIYKIYADTVFAFSKSIFLPPSCFQDVIQENRGLPIECLRNFGVNESNISLLKKQGYKTIGDICSKGLCFYYYAFLHKALRLLETPIAEIFCLQVKNLKESLRISLLRKSQGDTLQVIADDMNLTRERVRQLNRHAIQQLLPFADMVAQVILRFQQPGFACGEMEALFNNSKLSDCCKFILKSSSFVQYLSFADKFVRSSRCPKNLSATLKKFICEVIGDGLNYYDSLQSIQFQLKEYGLQILNFEDIMNCLVKSGYHFYGDFVIKKSQSYALVCHDAILKYFPKGIKLDANENNKDMMQLRKIIDRYYHGLSLPNNNRALTARITPLLILCGRGRYCAVESVVCERSFFKKVLKFIEDSPQSSLLYSEIFSKFKEEFASETNITNKHFLHGMLKYLYPDEFMYERDLLSKNGCQRQNTDARICELLLERTKAMSKQEILQNIPGLNASVISFATEREEKLIQWDYNMYNHMDNLRIYPQELELLKITLKEQSKHFHGYLSDVMLYKFASGLSELQSMFQRNHIQNAANLFYIAGYYFKHEYRFRRPHIISKDFPVKDPTVFNIAKILLNYENGINYENYLALSDRLGWADGTRYSVFSELEKGCVQISETDYMPQSSFHFTEDMKRQFVNCISRLIAENGGYCAVNGIEDYSEFPNCGYKWNGFLIESILVEFETPFKVVSPQVKGRRYQRGIILPAESPIDSFEDLILDVVLKDGIKEMTESEFTRYLKEKNLIFKTIPQELYRCSKMPFKNEKFIFE